MKTHRFSTTRTDSLTGKEYQECMDCNAISVEGNDFFNRYCPAEDLKIRGVIKRAKAEERGVV